MRRLGATIAIDDFGPGFSNLAMLERLQPSIIKIDRSLLIRADRARSLVILGAAIGLGQALEARIVVEGVETKEQLSLVVSLGCDLAQGYFLAPPMPVADLTDWTGKPVRAHGRDGRPLLAPFGRADDLTAGWRGSGLLASHIVPGELPGRGGNPALVDGKRSGTE
jgi:predicted signal transduction protein with EAL and GGDEF domain